MPDVCILTDSTAQFTTPNFLGRERVFVIPLTVEYQEQTYRGDEGLHIDQLPASVLNGQGPRAFPPSVSDFEKTFLSLGQRYTQIMVLLLSDRLCPALNAARQAAENVMGYFTVQVMDSQTTAGGLGLLVQRAAEAAAEGQDTRQIEHMLNGLIPRLYTVFAIQGLTYLAQTGFLDPSQALVGELLELTPFFIYDDGNLVSSHKIRSPRHLIDSLVDFVSEFGDLEHLSLLQGAQPMGHESRLFRERVSEYFPGIPVSEHAITPALAAILGPQCTGMFVLESETDQT